MLFMHQNRVEMQARKLITYHDLRLSLCNHMGLPSVARLQRQEVSRAKKEARGIGTFPTGIYGGLHPLLNFANVFDHADHTAKAHKSTGSTASFEIHGKCMVNLIFYRPWRSFQYFSMQANHTHPSHTRKGKSNRWQWHHPWSCRQSCRSHHLLL
jgi:hypothetical protein